MKKIYYILPISYIVYNKNAALQITIDKQTTNNFRNILVQSNDIIYNSKNDIISKSFYLSLVLLNKKSLQTYYDIIKNIVF
jgi:hypothetical protein